MCTITAFSFLGTVCRSKPKIHHAVTLSVIAWQSPLVSAARMEHVFSEYHVNAHPNALSVPFTNGALNLKNKTHKTNDIEQWKPACFIVKTNL